MGKIIAEGEVMAKEEMAAMAPWTRQIRKSHQLALTDSSVAGARLGSAEPWLLSPGKPS